MSSSTSTDVPISKAELQAKITKRVLTISLIVGSCTYLYYHYCPINPPNFRTVGDKFAYVLQCNIPSAWFIISLMAYIIHIRVNTHQINPLSNKDLHKLDVPARVLQNTIEQIILSLFFQLTSATYFGNKHMKLIPVCAFWFLLGRILFWIGYNDPRESRTRRGIGFMFTLSSYVLLALFSTFIYLRDTVHSVSMLF
ncbi:hypothetical protein HELRODRAFT_179895 [Helobdella robusta]|uniref:Uncharacterized protein n=1 Tax=Helobdella robusta TaxID=6412 RepID=T1FF85_HELRO|nr:hypothetical protein HELRODRAFT_179895 [Helobdella robusta]ESN95036.1 hypothetical protein HELRODRAFT_179895 [Helobdella robusta]